MTGATEGRIYRALTDVGRKKFKEFCETMTPRRALRRLSRESQASWQDYLKRQREIFIEHALPFAQMSIADYQETNADEFMRRWKNHIPSEQKRILARFRVKNVTDLRRVFLGHSREHWLEEGMSFAWHHKEAIAKAQEYNLPVNEEAAAVYLNHDTQTVC